MVPITIPDTTAVRMTTGLDEPNNGHAFNGIAKNAQVNPSPVSVDSTSPNNAGQPILVQSAGDVGRAGYVGFCREVSVYAGKPINVLRDIVVDGYSGVIPGQPVYIDQQSADTASVALSTPTAPTLTPSTTGGTLPAATTYNYRITALNAIGETLPSPEASNATTTGSTSSITVSWTAVAGAVSYNVYGRTAGGELFLVNVPASVTSWVDTGALTPAGALPGSSTAVAGSGGSGLTHTKPQTGLRVEPIGVGWTNTKIMFF